MKNEALEAARAAFVTEAENIKEMAEFFAIHVFYGPSCENCPAKRYCNTEEEDKAKIFCKKALIFCKKAFDEYLHEFFTSDFLYRIERRIQAEQGKDGE